MPPNTHLYLQDTADSFTPWVRHRRDYQFLGPMPWPPHALPEIGEPYDKEAILEYLAFCQDQVAARVPWLDLQAPSGVARGDRRGLDWRRAGFALA